MTAAIQPATSISVGRKIWRTWGWLIAILCGVTSPGLIVFLAVINGAGFPGWGLGGLILVAAAFLLFSLFIAVQLAIWIAWVFGLKKRGPSMASVLFSCGVFIGALPGLGISHVAKPLAAKIVAARAQRVVDVVESYERAHGVPPETLEQLVPEFLAGPVETGSPAYPEVRYRQGLQGSTSHWMLEIPMTELMGFDYLYYCPVSTCGSESDEGRLVAATRNGRWVYYTD